MENSNCNYREIFQVGGENKLMKHLYKYKLYEHENLSYPQFLDSVLPQLIKNHCIF